MSKAKSILTFALRGAAILVATPPVLFMLLALLIYFPPFQQWAVRQATRYASAATGMEISIGRVDLDWPLDIGLTDVSIKSTPGTHSSLFPPPSSLFRVRHITANVRVRPLLRGEVRVDGITLHQARLATGTMIAQARVEGTVERIALPRFRLIRPQIRIGQADISRARLHVWLTDSVPPPDTTQATPWDITLRSLTLTHCSVTLHTPGDSLRVVAEPDTLALHGGHFDLGHEAYTLSHATWCGGAVSLTLHSSLLTPHSSLLTQHLSITLDSLSYADGRARATISHAAGTERDSRFVLSDLQATVAIDSQRVSVPRLLLRTPHSRLTATADADLRALDASRPLGEIAASLEGTVGRRDVEKLATALPRSLTRLWGNRPLRLRAAAHGNIRRLRLTRMEASIPGLIALKGTARVENPTDPRRLSATTDVSLRSPRMGRVDVRATLHGHQAQATARLALGGIRLDTLTLGLDGTLALATNLKDSHRLTADISEVTLRGHEQTYHPGNLTLEAMTTRDTTHIAIASGDLQATADAGGGPDRLMRTATTLWQSLQTEVGRGKREQTRIAWARVMRHLPTGRLRIESGQDNIVWRILGHYGYSYQTVNADMALSPHSGVDGTVHIGGLTADSISIDTVALTLHADSAATLHALVQNGRDNPRYAFRALLDGRLHEGRLALDTHLYDAKDQLGIRLPLTGELQRGSITLHVDTSRETVLGYKTFQANEDNYVSLGGAWRMTGDLTLRAADGMGIQVYSDRENEEADQDVTVSLSHFDLGHILAVIPYMPAVGGMMDSDFHVVLQGKTLSISSSVDIAGMTYEGVPLGNLGTEFVYMPIDDGRHYVDGLLRMDDEEVCTLRGTYLPEGEGTIDAALTLQRLPLHLLDTFIPDRLLGFRGTAGGTLSVSGAAANPRIDGVMRLDSASLYSEPYGVEMQMAATPVRIEANRMRLDRYALTDGVRDGAEHPLLLTGTIDFTRLSRIMLSLQMQTRGFKIIDARENPRSIAYGRAYVDFMANVSGPVERLTMRGKVNVLGSTDMTYVMRDTPVSADSQMDELVQFLTPADTLATATAPQRPPVQGLDMLLGVSIDEAARIQCLLTPDHSNYIDLIGGGDLRMTYSATGDIRLNGRYTLSGGEMKYSLPIIPLKTFQIADGSYVEFQGDPMNPTLHITATENVKASVNSGGDSRMVDFQCGVSLSQTLAKLGLQFVITAPSDMAMSDELSTMTPEGRSKVAVTMLASGMYLADGNTSAFSMNSALSAFLQSEINSVAGRAMQSMGLGLGMTVDNAVASDGGMHTDYRFQFSKRLLSNRLSVNIGGKISSGSEVDAQSGQSNTFFDNVELQYRLTNKYGMYLRLYYDNNKYDWLQGTLGQYGVGFMWKRKARHFRDIFRK